MSLTIKDRKRSCLSDVDADQIHRAKSAGIWEDKEFANLDEAVAEVAVLKSYLDAAVQFIHSKGLSSSRFPLTPHMSSRISGTDS